MAVSYPTRCKIVDVTGQEKYGVALRTPDESKPHIGKVGIARLVDAHGGQLVMITLDDGTVIGGHECWWEPEP